MENKQFLVLFMLMSSPAVLVQSQTYEEECPDNHFMVGSVDEFGVDISPSDLTYIEMIGSDLVPLNGTYVALVNLSCPFTDDGVYVDQISINIKNLGDVEICLLTDPIHHDDVDEVRSGAGPEDILAAFFDVNKELGHLDADVLHALFGARQDNIKQVLVYMEAGDEEELMISDFSITYCCPVITCDPNPCLEDGVCSPFGGEVVSCCCAPGFEGLTCEINTDECAFCNNPCENGGTCVDEVATFTCSCPPGYTGPFCEICIACYSDGDCDNGGSCVDWTCACADEFGGKTCSYTLPPDDMLITGVNDGNFTSSIFLVNMSDVPATKQDLVLDAHFGIAFAADWNTRKLYYGYLGGIRSIDIDEDDPMLAPSMEDVININLGGSYISELDIDPVMELIYFIINDFASVYGCTFDGQYTTPSFIDTGFAIAFSLTLDLNEKYIYVFVADTIDTSLMRCTYAGACSLLKQYMGIASLSIHWDINDPSIIYIAGFVYETNIPEAVVQSYNILTGTVAEVYRPFNTLSLTAFDMRRDTFYMKVDSVDCVDVICPIATYNTQTHVEGIVEGTDAFLNGFTYYEIEK